MKVPAILAAALLASACSTMETPTPIGPAPVPASAATSITYETSPCFGFCPVYRVTVNADGGGSFEGIRNTGVTGTQTFTISRAQYQAFAAHVEPLRPAGGSRRLADQESCTSFATDLPSAEVTWRGGRETQTFYYYYGCGVADREAISERLRSAPDLLPIAQMIQRRPGQPLTR